MKTSHLKVGVKPKPKCHVGLISIVPKAMDDFQQQYNTMYKPYRDF